MATIFKRNDKETGKPKRGAKWIMRYKDEDGCWVNKGSETTCKQTAQALANQLETEAAKRRSGLLDSTHDSMAEAKKPIRVFVADYKAKLQNAGRSEKHVSEQISILNAFIEFKQPKTARDVKQSCIQEYVSSLRQKKRSNRTLEKHIAGLRTFFEWMIDNNKLIQNPTKGIKKPSPSKDRRHKRRMLTREEWNWLSYVTKEEPCRWNSDGKSRALLYWTAIETGYRSNELRQIKVSNLMTQGDKSFIWIEGDTTKNGKPARQYLSSQLASKLVTHAKGKRKGDALFQMPSKSNVVKMLRDDLVEARAAWLKEVEQNDEEWTFRSESDFLVYEDQESRKLDFHALRHTCGAWLIIAGVDIKTVQTIMRHSTPNLTLNTYGHLMEGAEARAVETLNAGAQQICSKLSAAEEILDASACENEAQSQDAETKKDLGKTKAFATQCTNIPISALAPPVGLEPTTNGLTVRCSTN